MHDHMTTPEIEAKATAIFNGIADEQYYIGEAVRHLCRLLAMITSADKTKRETAKRRVRELAAKGKTGI